jgi:hypothetical protein
LHAIIGELCGPSPAIAGIQRGDVCVSYPVDGLQIDATSDPYLLGHDNLLDGCWASGSTIPAR